MVWSDAHADTVNATSDTVSDKQRWTYQSNNYQVEMGLTWGFKGARFFGLSVLYWDKDFGKIQSPLPEEERRRKVKGNVPLWLTNGLESAEKTAVLSHQMT